MKLVRYLHEHIEGYGVLFDKDVIVSFTAIAKNIKPCFPKTIEGFS